MPVHLVDHPLAQQALFHLRHPGTTPPAFRTLATRLSLLVTMAATADLATRTEPVETPLESTSGRVLQGDTVAVPVLRAGLGMLEAVLMLLPDTRVGHIGLARDEATAVASGYYLKLPPLDAETTVLLLDPMLATGGSACAALERLHDAGAQRVRLLCLVAAPEGVSAVERGWPRVPIYSSAVDRELDARKYIRPGLGDFGDRLHGT